MEQANTHTLNAIHLEEAQFEESIIALPWDQDKYGKAKYWDEIPFIKGLFFGHKEMNGFEIGMN